MCWFKADQKHAVCLTRQPTNTTWIFWENKPNLFHHHNKFEKLKICCGFSFVLIFVLLFIWGNFPFGFFRLPFFVKKKTRIAYSPLVLYSEFLLWMHQSFVKFCSFCKLAPLLQNSTLTFFRVLQHVCRSICLSTNAVLDVVNGKGATISKAHAPKKLQSKFDQMQAIFNLKSFKAKNYATFFKTQIMKNSLGHHYTKLCHQRLKSCQVNFQNCKHFWL